MKKSLIALAVAGALAAPMVAQADATLYGSLRIKVASLDGTSANGGTNDNVDVQDNSSRIGVKGSSELFSGAKAIFQFEQAVSTETGAWAGGRLANVGITGDFGTALFGRIWTPYYSWTGAQTDILDNNTSAASVYQVGAHRASNVMAYVSPSMSGFQVAAAVLVNDGTTATTTDDESVDGAHVAAKYENGGLNVGVSYLGFENNSLGLGDGDVISLGASYTMDAVYVAARYENDDRNNADADAYELAGSYTMGNTKLLANYIDDDRDADDQWSLEVQQKLGKQARVFAAYIDRDELDGGEGFMAGYRVDF